MFSKYTDLQKACLTKQIFIYKQGVQSYYEIIESATAQNLPLNV